MPTDERSSTRVSLATLEGVVRRCREDSDTLVDFIHERVAFVLGRGSPDIGDVTANTFLKVLDAFERNSRRPWLCSSGGHRDDIAEARALGVTRHKNISHVYDIDMTEDATPSSFSNS